MYPQSELARLAACKVAMRRRIARRRIQWEENGAVVARPLVWLDRMQAAVRKLSPWIKFGAVPLGFLLRRSLFPRLKFLGPLLRWSPLLVPVARGVGLALAASGARSTRPAGRSRR
jgi:hypothetical protein